VRRAAHNAEFEEFLADMKALGIQRHPTSTDAFVYGAIVGSAVIEGVVRGSKSDWAVCGNDHWVLGGARRCAARKGKGQLGFFKG